MRSGTRLEEELDQRSDQSFLLVPPGGNYGDLLIYKGLEKLLDQKNIDYTDFRTGIIDHDFLTENLRAVPFDADISNPAMVAHDILVKTFYQYYRKVEDPDVVYIHGGAHLSDIWGNGIDCLHLVAQNFDCPIIIGPSTCYFDDTDPVRIFESIDNDVLLFCREEFTYERVNHLERGCQNTNVYCSDDTAFYLDPSDFQIQDKEEKYELIALRTDRESALSDSDNIGGTDTEFDLVRQDVSVEAANLKEFVRIISNAENIITDRLHVAIMAYIFEIDTNLYKNSYYKNKAVYEYSLYNSECVEIRDAH